MNLYELNQSGYNSLPKMTKAEIERAKEKVLEFVNYLPNNGGFYMFLCNELRYYTMFALQFLPNSKTNMVDTLFELTQSLGTLKAVEVDSGMVEFWISKDGECHMYAFFNYDEGVIKL